jgi:hypothetical protein
MSSPASLTSLARNSFCSRFLSYESANNFLRKINLTSAFRRVYIGNFNFFYSNGMHFVKILDHLCPQQSDEDTEAELVRMYIYIRLADSFLREEEQEIGSSCSLKKVFRPFYDSRAYKMYLQYYNGDYYENKRDEKILKNLEERRMTRSSEKKRLAIYQKRKKLQRDYDILFTPTCELKLFDEPRRYEKLAFRWLEELYSDCRCDHCNCQSCTFEHCNCLHLYVNMIHSKHGHDIWYLYFLGYSSVIHSAHYYNFFI